jgi:hypothetical protein
MRLLNAPFCCGNTRYFKSVFPNHGLVMTHVRIVILPYPLRSRGSFLLGSLLQSAMLAEAEAFGQT